MDATPSRRLSLAEGIFEIRNGQYSHPYLCNVSFSLRESGSLRVEPQQPVSEICPGFNSDGPFFVTIPGVKEDLECHPVSSTLSFGGEQSGVSVVLQPRFSCVAVDTASLLARVNAGVLNLGHYQFDLPGGRSAFTLSHGSWLFEFTPVDELTFLYPPWLQSEEYFFTHQVCVRKTDDSLFSCPEARDQLGLLSTFLSFCHGHWVGTALAVGITEDGTVGMEEWGTRLVSPWVRTTNWLDEHHGQCMVELFPKFAGLFSDAGWKETLEKIVYWYVRGDTNFVGPDGALILLQASLERLAWHFLVGHLQCISAEGFTNGLKAPDQLRLLLSRLAIPTAVPTGLKALNKAAKQLNPADGPQVLVQVRNRLVHPPKKGTSQQSLPYYEAYKLGKWYLESAVLSICGYAGCYSDRTRERRWVGEVEPVPWAK